MTDSREARAGILFGVAAYVWWGVVAVYFKIVRAVAPLEILAHRIVWSFIFLLATIAVLRRWPQLALVFAKRRTLALLAVSTTLIAVNWFIYIWAVTNNRMIEASLGYFINPLVSVVLGFFALNERLQGRERIAVLLAAAGVLWLTFGAGLFPWISLALAVTFALYGLVRKVSGVTAIEGLMIETALLLPLAFAYLMFRLDANVLAFGHMSRSLDLWLLAAGPITAFPLLWFAAAVRRLRLSTIGLLQYISPTIQFALAVMVFDEPFGSERLIAFILIWCAIVVYSTANIGRE
jgi:chloramphenicol-sensitive protein RarD